MIGSRCSEVIVCEAVVITVDVVTTAAVVTTVDVVISVDVVTTVDVVAVVISIDVISVVVITKGDFWQINSVFVVICSDVHSPESIFTKIADSPPDFGSQRGSWLSQFLKPVIGKPEPDHIQPLSHFWDENHFTKNHEKLKSNLVTRKNQSRRKKRENKDGRKAAISTALTISDSDSVVVELITSNLAFITKSSDPK